MAVAHFVSLEKFYSLDLGIGCAFTPGYLLPSAFADLGLAIDTYCANAYKFG
jgi:hypothetical protein